MSLAFVFVLELGLCFISLSLEGPAIPLVADLVIGYNVSIHVIRYSTSGHTHTHFLIVIHLVASIYGTPTMFLALL